jgi:hypothetical protein
MRKTILAVALLLTSLSNFDAPNAYAEMQEHTDGHYVGIGAAVLQQNNKFCVIAIAPGSPATHAGILTGDIISTVDGKSTSVMSLAELTKAVIGPKGTHVQIGVTREGQPNLLVFDVVRDEVQVPNSDVGQIPPGVTAAQASDNPADPHDPGVYIMVSAQDGKERMTSIQQVDPGSANLGIGSVLGMAFTYGISKAKFTTDIPGAHAAVRTQEKSPVFYMYFPSDDYLKSHGFVTASPATVFGTDRPPVIPPDIIRSPTQFSLLLLEEKKDHRETTVGQLGMFSGVKDTIDNKKAIKFNAEMIRPNVYKVTPETNLKPGEYAFVAASGSNTVVSNAQISQNDSDYNNIEVGSIAVYDFGVDAR